jgi:hypothetical protein
MTLTTAQITALKADIAANSDTNIQPMTNAGHAAIAALYNLPTTTDVWRTEAPVSVIADAINWASYTPVDVPDGTAAYTNRALVIQTKQMNLQMMLQGRTSVDASKQNIRAGLRDAVTALPAGVSGASVAAGGANGATVLAALTRKALRIEKLFMGSTASTGPVTANLLTYEGAVTADEVATARES